MVILVNQNQSSSIKLTLYTHTTIINWSMAPSAQYYCIHTGLFLQFFFIVMISADLHLAYSKSNRKCCTCAQHTDMMSNKTVTMLSLRKPRIRYPNVLRVIIQNTEIIQSHTITIFFIRAKKKSKNNNKKKSKTELKCII